MKRWYAFNGDADGLCALQQLRLAEPGDAALVTGVKRDIALLRRLDARPGDEITVLDVSLAQNRPDVVRLLEAGAHIRYFDHHHAGEVVEHPRLDAHIDERPEVCTSMLVDGYLGGRFHAWAIVAAFGDGLQDVATRMAAAAGLTHETTASLERLGVLLNYNAYGSTVGDLHVAPAALAAMMLPYADPLRFWTDAEVVRELDGCHDDDMRKALSLVPVHQGATTTVLVLPDAPWARRVIGTLANAWMQRQPGRAIAILTPNASDGYAVSVRVPGTSSVDADAICRAFPTGGGRRRAAGINHLPRCDVDRFAAEFEAHFPAVSDA